MKKENVPVALTLKEGKEGFVLSHHKKFPVLLNNLGDVMFLIEIYIFQGRGS